MGDKQLQSTSPIVSSPLHLLYYDLSEYIPLSVFFQHICTEEKKRIFITFQCNHFLFDILPLMYLKFEDDKKFILQQVRCRSSYFMILQKILFEVHKTSAPTGAWKCNFPPFWEIITGGPTKRDGQTLSQGSCPFNNQKQNFVLRLYFFSGKGHVTFLILHLLCAWHWSFLDKNPLLRAKNNFLPCSSRLDASEDLM